MAPIMPARPSGEPPPDIICATLCCTAGLDIMFCALAVNEADSEGERLGVTVGEPLVCVCVCAVALHLQELGVVHHVLNHRVVHHGTHVHASGEARHTAAAATSSSTHCSHHAS